VGSGRTGPRTAGRLKVTVAVDSPADVADLTAIRGHLSRAHWNDSL